LFTKCCKFPIYGTFKLKTNGKSLWLERGKKRKTGELFTICFCFIVKTKKQCGEFITSKQILNKGGI